jgi:hypothetical protein
MKTVEKKAIAYAQKMYSEIAAGVFVDEDY